jgi:hypothetical protein
MAAVRVGWGRNFLDGMNGSEGGGEGWTDPYVDALRDQLVRAIDLRDFARATSLGEEITAREVRVSSNDPRTVALVAETLRLGGGRGPGEGAGAGAPAALSYLSKKSLSSFSSSSSASSAFRCHPWILFVRAMAEPPGDVSCLPERQRAGFAQGLEIARQRGWAVTAWNRVATQGRP